MFYRMKNEDGKIRERLYQSVQFGYRTCIIMGQNIYHLGSTDLILISNDDLREYTRVLSKRKWRTGISLKWY